MIFSLSAAVLLAISSVSLAIPVSDASSQLTPRAAKLVDASVCDLSNVTFPLGGLSPPSGNLHLAHVAVGRGTQNYTCDTTNSSAIPKAIGAKATLFNVTCLTTSPQNLVASIPGLALKAAIPSTSITVQTALAQLTSGHHYFTNMTTPFFDLETDVPHNYGTVSAAKLAAVPAPKDAPVGADGAAAVPWLKLAGWAGNYKEVYRIYTAGGSAPANCSGQTAAFEVEYSAVYYFYAANSS